MVILITVVETDVFADADWRHAGRPFSVGHAPVHLLTVERVELVAVLTVVFGHSASLVLFVTCRYLGQGQGRLRAPVSQIVAVADRHGRRAMSTCQNRLGRRN